MAAVLPSYENPVSIRLDESRSLRHQVLILSEAQKRFNPISTKMCSSFPQSNVLEASPDMKRESEKEWYFGNADKERRGPFSFEEVWDHLKSSNTALLTAGRKKKKGNS